MTALTIPTLLPYPPQQGFAGGDAVPTITMRKPIAARERTPLDAQTRERARDLLVHRANGGIHNTTIALKLVKERTPSHDVPPEQMASFVAAGIRGMANASRALQLLGALIGVEAATEPPDADTLADDVATILRAESSRRGITLRIDLAHRGAADPAISLDALAQTLVAGLAAVETAAPNTALTIRTRKRASAPLTVDIETAPARPRKGVFAKPLAQRAR